MPGAKVECPEWIETLIYRKDRARPTKLREFLDEVYRGPFTSKGRSMDGPWQTHTKRQLRHKSLIQCARIAFGFVGIYEPDEAERIRTMDRSIVDTSIVGTSLVDKTSIVDSAKVPPAVSQLTESKALSMPLSLEDRQQLDPLLVKIAERAREQNNAWSAAQQYVSGRYQGAVLDYALQYLRDQEACQQLLSQQQQALNQPQRVTDAQLQAVNTEMPELAHTPVAC